MPHNMMLFNIAKDRNVLRMIWNNLTINTKHLMLGVKHSNALLKWYHAFISARCFYLQTIWDLNITPSITIKEHVPKTHI